MNAKDLHRKVEGINTVLTSRPKQVRLENFQERKALRNLFLRLDFSDKTL